MVLQKIRIEDSTYTYNRGKRWFYICQGVCWKDRIEKSQISKRKEEKDHEILFRFTPIPGACILTV
jgi:hypothetical protein